jgi:hypothetical protein
MTFFQALLRAYGVYGRQSLETNLPPLQNPESSWQRPGSTLEPKDEIQVIEEQMDTINGYLLVVEQQNFVRDNETRGPQKEILLERVAFAMEGALQALEEKRNRMVQQRANGKSL